MSVDLRKVKKLIELVEESGISELEVRDGDETIRIARHGGSGAGGAVAAGRPSGQPRPLRGPGICSRSSGHQVRSPMAGTFYTLTGAGCGALCGCRPGGGSRATCSASSRA